MASVPGFAVSAKALEADSAAAKVRRIERELVSVRRKAKNEKDPDRAARAKGQLVELEEQLKRYAPLARSAKPLDTNPVGTGPFIFESASTDNYIQLKRNPNWWFGRSIGMPDMPYFDGIRVSVIPDPSVRLANLKAGKLDNILLDAIQYRLVKNDPRFSVATVPMNWLVFLTFNHAKGPCSDIRVRKAISHAIDRRALVMGTQFGLGRVASCMYPDDHWAHNPNLKPVSYDPELSKRLLKEAGYANGLTIRGFTLNTPEAQVFAKAVMAMLAKVGITWRPVFLGITGMIEPFRKLDFHIIGNLYPWIQEPDHMATLLYDPTSPLNNGRSRNDKAIALIRLGRETTDEAKRAKIYFELEKVLYDNYEDAWLWWPTAVLASSRNIQGVNRPMWQQYGEGYFFSHPMWFKDGHP
jgi:peptide/nickel transport system substrate-binding protein